jgi:hypothetical protein
LVREPRLNAVAKEPQAKLYLSWRVTARRVTVPHDVGSDFPDGGVELQPPALVRRWGKGIVDGGPKLVE